MTVLIAGPTACGKSALAMARAKALGGTVINADSMQVYRDLEILTARPSAEDIEAVPHALYGHVDAAERHSVARWLLEVEAAIAASRDAGRPPVIVGGTGLYFAALTEGLSAIPAIPDDVRAHWRARQEVDTPEALHAALAERDAVMAARLRPSDPQRIVRALEVFEATGRSLATWQAVREDPILPLDDTVDAVVVTPDRADLRERIAQRFAAMMDGGAVDEAARLAARGLDPTLPAMKAIGVAPLTAFAQGRLDRAEAVDAAILQTRQYAKRQETWMRNRFAHWRRVAPP
ncbi:MAG: tRNA (adenosine(37)-N6)-dimethylallyltransferase MiaA [Pseudomonadota bacterium]